MRHTLEMKTIAAINGPGGYRAFGLIRARYLKAMASWGYSKTAAFVAWCDTLDIAHLESGCSPNNLKRTEKETMATFPYTDDYQMTDAELTLVIRKAREAFQAGKRVLYGQLRTKLARHYGVVWGGLIEARWPEIPADECAFDAPVQADLRYGERMGWYSR